jgi:hypothetical protein
LVAGSNPSYQPTIIVVNGLKVNNFKDKITSTLEASFGGSTSIFKLELFHGVFKIIASSCLPTQKSLSNRELARDCTYVLAIAGAVTFKTETCS